MSEAWLLWETSGRGGSVGLTRGSNLGRTAELDPARRHNRDLAPLVAGLLRDEGLTPADVRGVMVSVGPGSYTGLRVGVMSAKAFAYAAGCELVAVPTLAIWAEMVAAFDGVVDVVSDGLQGLVYAQRFRWGGAGWEAADALHLAPVAAWAAATAGVHRVVTGPAAGLVANHLSDADQTSATSRPGLAAMLAVGRRLSPVARGELFALEPLYLRPSSAEEQAVRKAAGG